MSGTNFFPITTEENTAPRYKSTAKARGFLADPDSGYAITGTTGVFNLWFEGTVVVNARAMPVDATLGTGWCSCRVTHTELAQQGLYQWEMTLTSPDTLWVLTDMGTFTI